MKNNIFPLTAIIVTLIFAAGILGFLVGFRASDKPNVAGVNIQQNDKITPVGSQEAILSVSQSSESGQISESEQLVNSFYRFYINCLNQNGDCSYQNRPDIDYPQLMDKTRAVSGMDRLLCAQNIPKVFRIDHSTQDSENLESVYLIESFENSQVQLIVEVQRTPSGPKIINVICPRA